MTHDTRGSGPSDLPGFTPERRPNLVGGNLGRVKGCDAFVATVSFTTLTSDACRRELDWALALGKPVLRWSGPGRASPVCRAGSSRRSGASTAHGEALREAPLMRSHGGASVGRQDRGVAQAHQRGLAPVAALCHIMIYPDLPIAPDEAPPNGKVAGLDVAG
jgi:hypothetical protein